MVKSDTSWNASINSSIDAQKQVENASELSQEREGQISEGSSSGEFKKSYDNPLLLTTISSIPEIVKAILDCHPQAEHINKKE